MSTGIAPSPNLARGIEVHGIERVSPHKHFHIRYPEAGTGSSYFYAEIAFLQREEHRHFKFARMSKFIVGWASHLYYWIYPGVMVAFIGNKKLIYFAPISSETNQPMNT